MAFLMRRLQVSAISCSSLSPALNSRGLPTAIARESIAEFDPVEQVLDRHAQLDIVNISQDEHGLDNPAERLERGIEAVLSGINILRQSRRLYGCGPLKGAFSQPTMVQESAAAQTRARR